MSDCTDGAGLGGLAVDSTGDVHAAVILAAPSVARFAPGGSDHPAWGVARDRDLAGAGCGIANIDSAVPGRPLP